MVVLHLFEVGFIVRTPPLKISLTARLACYDGFLRTLMVTNHLISPVPIAIVGVFRSVAWYACVIIFHIITAVMTVIFILGNLDWFLILVSVVSIAFPISVSAGVVVVLAVGAVSTTILLVLVGSHLPRLMILFLRWMLTLFMGSWILILLWGQWLEHGRAHMEHNHLLLDLLHTLFLLLLLGLELLDSCCHMFRLGGIFMHNFVCRFVGLHCRFKVGQDIS